jgi:hypothetical protein
MLNPGQELRTFTVYHPVKRETQLGRVVRDSEIEIGTCRAILAHASPEEKQRWRQLEHPITHKIIMQRQPEFSIVSGDVFKHKNRRFVHQALPYNVGDLTHWTIFYCEERADL